MPEALQETVPELLQFSQDQESMNLEVSEELSVADLPSDPQDGLGEGWTVASAIYPLPLYVCLKSNRLAIIIMDLLKDPGLESS